MNPNYVNWYCLNDEDFNAKVKKFADSVGITNADLEKHHDFMWLRKWTDSEIKRIDIPDMLDYTHSKIVKVLNELNWKHKKEFFHADCLFAPILVCCQRYAEGYSKKHLIISNLTMNDISIEEGKQMLLAEENIDLEDIYELDTFLSLIDIDDVTFELSINKNWKNRTS